MIGGWDEVAAVIVTRPGGKANLEAVMAGFPAFAEVVIWRNGEHVEVNRADGTFLVDQGKLDLEELRATGAYGNVFPDLGVYGRYEAIRYTKAPVIFVQDDDCMLEPRTFERLLDAYEPGRIAALMPESRWPDYPDSCLVGWGALFDRDLPRDALARFTAAHLGDWASGEPLASEPGFYNRTCDVAFTTLTPHVKVPSALGVDWNHLPYAEGPDRMFRQSGHKDERDRMLQLARAVRDA